MLFSIEGIIKGEPEDLEIIANNYFEKFTSYDKKQNLLIYDTGFIYNKEKFKLFSGTYKEEEAILKGILALITGKYPQFNFIKFNIIDEEKKRVKIGLPRFCSCHPNRPDLFDLIEQKIDATQIYLKALDEPNLRWVLILFSQNSDFVPLSWGILYAIYEKIGYSMRDATSSEKKRTKDIISAEFKIDIKSINVFCILANKSRSPFEGMRHGGVISQEDEKEMNKYWSPDAISWGFKFIQDIARRWINYQYGIEIKEPRLNMSRIQVSF